MSCIKSIQRGSFTKVNSYGSESVTIDRVDPDKCVLLAHSSPYQMTSAYQQHGIWSPTIYETFFHINYVAMASYTTVFEWTLIEFA